MSELICEDDKLLPTMEELDFSVRTYNCLKRANINTLRDIFSRLDEGFETLLMVRNLGKSGIEEVLVKARICGYDVDALLDRYFESSSQEERERWDGLCKMLQSVSGSASEGAEQSEVRLNELDRMPKFLADRMKKYGVFTVDGLLSNYSSIDDLPISLAFKRLLVYVLDINGYRFSDCTVDRYPNVEEYIDFKRAESFDIGDLALPIEIAERMRSLGITVPRLIAEKTDFLYQYFEPREIAILLFVLDENRFRMKDCPCDQYVNIRDFIDYHIEVKISDLGLSPRIYHSLHQFDIDTLGRLLEFTRQELIEQKIVGRTAMKELVQVLQDNKAHLRGDTIYMCSSCGVKFPAVMDGAEMHCCEACEEKLKRVNRIKDYTVTIDGPDYSSYTDGTSGFTIFATVHNKTRKLVEVKLRDFMLFCDNRQWASTSYLTGYHFETEHIMPESSKTSAKIWSGTIWKEKRLINGDYISFSIGIKEKIYLFKFVMKDGRFEIDDYYTC